MEEEILNIVLSQDILIEYVFFYYYIITTSIISVKACTVHSGAEEYF